MRRGHPNVGGWRGENIRHFRPRGGGPQNFRPSRPFGILDTPRFPLLGPRPYRGSRQYNHGRPDNSAPEYHHDRNRYRLNNVSKPQDRGFIHHEKQMQPYHSRNIDNNYGDTQFYKDNQFHTNSMGDVDQRRPQHINPWTVPSYDNNSHFYNDHKSPHKTPRQYNKGDDLPDYTGHRPPASDHYTTTTGPNNNNSQYSHSVDDTVDIIRKRLQNRDKHQNEESLIDQQSNMDEDLRKIPQESYQDVPQEQPVKKKPPRLKQNTKSNCDTIKNKIVHQLFKMDKTKIHKLMDNPSSSSKFEYAISSLITEGQNSLNRHMRSVAEKSLCSSSSDFIQDNTNTIYEDTFMKQMQGVLDPQDTVLLVDLKPVVMAELSKFLQLDNYQLEAMQDMYQNQAMHEQESWERQHSEEGQTYQEYEMLAKEEPQSFLYDENLHENQYATETFHEEQSADNNYSNIDPSTADIDDRHYEYEQQSYEKKPLFQRRPTSSMSQHERCSESRQSRNSHETPRRSRETSRNSFDASRHSMENVSVYERDISKERSTELPGESEPAPPVVHGFDPNAYELSDDDDQFAEFDKQYHVEVDHNFIGNEYASRPPSPQSCSSIKDKSPCYSGYIETIDISAPPSEIVTGIDSQLLNIVKSNEEVSKVSTNRNATEPAMTKSHNEVKKEPILGKVKENQSDCIENVKTPFEEHDTSKIKDSKKETSKAESKTSTKSVLQSNTRKRSSDQKPSHRKEKRKRSANSESVEIANSIMNMFYNNDKSSKGTSKASKKTETADKAYSDKYVKRKEPHQKAKDKESEDPKANEAKHSKSSSHSILSPKDSLNNDALSKLDSKTKLKHIDMFHEQPKKGSSHQAHRNTGTPQTVAKSPEDIKPKPIIPIVTSFARKLSKRHIGTQVILKVKSKECQTNKMPKAFSICTQTDAVSLTAKNNESANPLERMKEIDMEIQLLLQEKFKLYNSLETKSMAVPMDTMPNLSMRIFKVNSEEANENEEEKANETHEEKANDSEDAIVDDFTSIPTEELEQIAFETMAMEEPSPIKCKKKNREQKILEQARISSRSPTARRPQNKRNTKDRSPCISLIEKIITDDRPIEDIISLDDLESPPRSKKKHLKSMPKKKNSKKSKSSKTAISIKNKLTYDIKECSVVLERMDVNKYLKLNEPEMQECIYELEVVYSPVEVKSKEEPIVTTDIKQCSLIKEDEVSKSREHTLVDVVEEVVNDLQFDMLDVSEDIIIGDNCELKADDKVSEPELITEEIILDNSQSSIEEGTIETAGSESECKMYDYSTNENLRREAITVAGNGDAVLAIECLDSNFLAACLDGNVYQFGADGQLLNTLRGTNQAVTCLTIVKEKYGTTVYTGSLDSRIRYYDLDTGMEKGPECNVLSPIQTMDLAWGTIFVGTRTGFVLQFECKNNMLIPVSSVKFSEQSILALRAMKEGARKVLLVAARSENVVTIKDAQTGLLLRTLQGPKMSVYTLLFEDGKVYCGTSSHNIHVFDYTSGTHVGSHEGGKGAVCLRASGGLLFAGCYDGCVYVYREGEVRPIAQIRGPSLMLLSLAIYGTKIIAGYKDRGLYIWKMPPAIVQEMIL